MIIRNYPLGLSTKDNSPKNIKHCGHKKTSSYCHVPPKKKSLEQSINNKTVIRSRKAVNTSVNISSSTIANNQRSSHRDDSVISKVSNINTDMKTRYKSKDNRSLSQSKDKSIDVSSKRTIKSNKRKLNISVPDIKISPAENSKTIYSNKENIALNSRDTVKFINGDKQRIGYLNNSVQDEYYSNGKYHARSNKKVKVKELLEVAPEALKIFTEVLKYYITPSPRFISNFSYI